MIILFASYPSLLCYKKQMATKENKTKNFVLRVDAQTMDALEAWAADEFRSVNGQLQWIIAEALKKSGRVKKEKKVKKTDTSEEEA